MLRITLLKEDRALVNRPWKTRSLGCAFAAALLLGGAGFFPVLFPDWNAAAGILEGTGALCAALALAFLLVHVLLERREGVIPRVGGKRHQRRTLYPVSGKLHR